MHNTTVTMKDGRVFSSPIYIFRPCSGYLTLFHIKETLYFEDMISAITENVRPGETNDEIQRARNYLRDARKYGWHGMDKNTPKQEWE